MARMKNGFLSGKIGNLVNYENRGEQVVRATPVRKAPPTEAELLNRFYLETTANFIKPIMNFIRIGFRNYHKNYEGFNAATSVLRKEALHKDGYDSFIDPTKARVSHGTLSNAEVFQVELFPDGMLELTWTPVINADAGPRDRVMLLAYNVEQATAVHETFGSNRYSGGARLQLPEGVPGTYHVYAAFIAEDLSRQSPSQYLGTVER